MQPLIVTRIIHGKKVVSASVVIPVNTGIQNSLKSLDSILWSCSRNAGGSPVSISSFPVTGACMHTPVGGEEMQPSQTYVTL